MKIKYEKTLVESQNLVVGDNIKVGGMVCEIIKVEDIFHYVPNASVRLTLNIVGESRTRKKEIVVFFPTGVPITTLK